LYILVTRMKLITPIIDLFFPPVCMACNGHLHESSLLICVNCRHQLPVTNFHLDDSDYVKKVFYGRVKLENATALLRFHKKGIVQQLIHNLKYRGHESIGELLGDWLGEELNTVDAYNDIDIVIPVPLHKAKLRKRGYNQVAKFGQQIAKALNVPYHDDILVKISSTNTQVFKKREARWQQHDGVFSIQNEKHLKGKHILLVDDIITTGATIEACANVLTKTHNNKLSIATMAIA